MKYLLLYFFSLVMIFISGCSDPVNKTIAEFKKTNYAKTEFECAGIKGQINTRRPNIINLDLRIVSEKKLFF